MAEPAKKIEQTRTAWKNDLYRIEETAFRLPGTTSLSPRARRYLFFLIALVRAGYCRVIAPMAVIADAIYRAQGQTASVSTLRSALAELESAGYLSRRKYRVGNNRKNAVIDIHVERFVYWTKIQTGNVVPYPTVDHISSCQQNLVGDDRTREEVRVNNDNYRVKKEEPRAHTRSNKNAKSKKKAATKKQNYHPIVYTLLCVLPRSPQKSEMIEIATREIATGTSDKSGIDWTYYARLWPALDHHPGGRRENTAKREIVPLLYSAVDRAMGTMTNGGNKEENPAIEIDRATESPSEIRSILDDWLREHRGKNGV